MAHALGAPGHRHDPHRAVEVGQLDRDAGLAAIIELDDARVIGEQFLGRRRAFDRQTQSVAARAHHARHALHPVDEPAIEIADLHPQPALGEIPVVRRGRLIAREVQNPEIDRRDRDIDRLSGLGALDPDRDLDGLARAHRAGELGRFGQRQRQLA